MKLKDKILINMPDNLTDLEKARYLYIELGKNVSFSTKFQNTDEFTFAQMMTNKVDINRFNDNQINCVMWAELYSQLLTKFNINNEIIDYGHKYVEFYIEGKRWCADATYESYNDLARIHNDDETLNFGPAIYSGERHSNDVLLDKQTVDLINTIDAKIGYNNSEKDNFNEVKKFIISVRNGTFDINKEIDCSNQTEELFILKLEYLFCKLGTLKVGYYEAKNFVRDLEYYLFTKEEMNKIKARELKRTNLDKNVDIVQCIYVYGEKEIYYYLLAPNLSIRRVSKEEVIKLSVLGYGLDGECIPGIDYPKKFVVGEVSANKKYKLYKNYKKDNFLQTYNIGQSKVR